jgi:hypothetical protein
MTSPRSVTEGRPTLGTRLVVERYASFRPSRVAGGRLVAGKRRVAGGRLVTGPRRLRPAAGGWQVAGYRPVSQMRPLLGVA